MRKTLLIACLAALAPSLALAQAPLPNPLVLGPNTIVGRGNAGTGYAYAMTFQEFVSTLSSLGISTAAGTAGGDLSGSYPNPTVAKINGTRPPNTGVLKGNGAGGIIAAVAGTDYAPATTGTSILKAAGGNFANAVAKVDYAPPTTGSSILKGDGLGGFAAAVSSTDYAPATSGTSLLLGNGSGGFTAYGGASGTANQWISALSANGTATKSQPAVSNLSGLPVTFAQGGTSDTGTALTSGAATVNFTGGTSVSASGSTVAYKQLAAKVFFVTYTLTITYTAAPTNFTATLPNGFTEADNVVLDGQLTSGGTHVQCRINAASTTTGNIVNDAGAMPLTASGQTIILSGIATNQ